MFDWMTDGGETARDANRWVEDKIDGLGEWMGILDPKEQEEGPVSVPLDARMNPPSQRQEERAWWDDGGQTARDANRWVEDKIDGLGEWLGVLDPDEQEEGPVSVPLDARMNPPAAREESSWWDDGGQTARDANRWVEDKIDGLGEWLGILDPQEEETGPVSVPM